MRVRVLATPGHTFTHLSYALDRRRAAIGVFSGGSLLYGSVGRPDLLGPTTPTPSCTTSTPPHRLADELPDTAAVYPTHGFGSFCSATQSDGTPPPSLGES
jgi:hydroxyacylglutathione hydrolase